MCVCVCLYHSGFGVVVCAVVAGIEINEQKREMIAKNFCPIMIILHKPHPLVANYLNRSPQLCTG